MKNWKIGYYADGELITKVVPADTLSAAINKCMIADDRFTSALLTMEAWPSEKVSPEFAITTNIQYQVRDPLTNTSHPGATIHCKQGEEYSDAAAIRRVKKALGWNGKRCNVEHEADAIIITRNDIGLECTITFHSYGNASK